MSKLSLLRSGTPTHTLVTLNGDLSVAVVAVPIDEIVQCEISTDAYIKALGEVAKDNAYIKEHAYNCQLIYRILRDPQNLSMKMADSAEEIMKNLDAEDITRILDTYTKMMINKAPKLEFINEEQLDEIKKHLEVTPLSDLNSVSLVHLMNFHQAMHLGQ